MGVAKRRQAFPQRVFPVEGNDHDGDALRLWLEFLRFGSQLAILRQSTPGTSEDLPGRCVAFAAIVLAGYSDECLCRTLKGPACAGSAYVDILTYLSRFLQLRECTYGDGRRGQRTDEYQRR